MGGSRIVIEGHEGTIGVGIIGNEHRTVGRGFLAHNEVGASHRGRQWYEN